MNTHRSKRTWGFLHIPRKGIFQLRPYTRKHTFFKAVDVWASAEESLGVFHPLIMALADSSNLNKERLEVMLTFWLAAWVDLEEELLSKLGGDHARDVFSFTLYSQLMPVISDYAGELDGLLDNPDLEAHELLATVMSANEETRRKLDTLSHKDLDGSPGTEKHGFFSLY